MTAPKLLVTGCRGQLGSGLLKLPADEFNIIGVDQEDFDIRDRNSIDRYFATHKPEIVLHTAAYTDVDGCESNQELARDINVTGTSNVARACRAIGAKMVYYSTDYVFDGQKKSAYIESDQPTPKTVYGKSKLAGEETVMANLDDYIILRIAWLYGLQGKNFVKTMIRLGKQYIDSLGNGENQEALKVVNDQVGNPTWTEDIVKQTKAAIQNNLKGLFHCTSEGETSWYRFACDIFEILSWNVEVQPCTTDDCPRPALRPHRSALENHRLKEIGMNTMRDYKTALREFILKNRKELTNEL